VLHVLTTQSINHLLAHNSWARDRLIPYAGQSARFECPPLAATLGIRPDGQVDAAPQAVPDVTIRFTPGLALRIAARDEAAWKEIAVSGNTDLAEALNHIARNLHWDLEEDLARLFGDIAAHRMAQTGAALRQWGAQASDNLARALVEYWIEEQPLIARSGDVERFCRDVDQLRDDIARIEKRVELISTR
jgi:ubiquinone biosynthesis protein UbiJ